MKHHTPPWTTDEAVLHNPKGVSAEQVGINHRLLLPWEVDGRHKGVAQLWDSFAKAWCPAEITLGIMQNVTYRVPLSAPWPHRWEVQQKARERGEKIEFRGCLFPGEWDEWERIINPSWIDNDGIEYRIAPKEPIPSDDEPPFDPFDTAGLDALRDATFTSIQAAGEAAIRKLTKRVAAETEALTEHQLTEALRQALTCGDFVRQVSMEGQRVTYEPARRERELCNRISYLQKWKYETIEDLQTIAATIALPPTAGVHDKILPAIERLKAENAELKAKLEQMDHETKALPLCGGHAEAWFCDRDNLLHALEGKCWVCENASAQLREIKAEVKPEKWAKEKAAHAAGKRIQWFKLGWVDTSSPGWYDHIEYRVHPDDDKPTPAPEAPSDVEPPAKKWTPKFHRNQNVKSKATGSILRILSVAQSPDGLYEVCGENDNSTIGFYCLEHHLEPLDWIIPRQLPGFRPLIFKEYWHTQGFTKEMLPEGWRPLLLGEEELPGDEWWSSELGWQVSLGKSANCVHNPARTKRPLPPLAVPSAWKPKFKVGDRVKHLLTGSPGTVYEYCTEVREIFVHLDTGSDVNGPNDSFESMPWTLSRHIPGFRPLADGEEWHRQDWTQDMLPEGWRPLLMGEKIASSDVIWSHGKGPWRQCLMDYADGALYNLRTQRPLPPLPAPVELVPLEAKDVPPGSVFRLPYWPECVHKAYSKIGTDGVQFGTQATCSWADMKAIGILILRPGQTEWQPCSKVKEATP